MPPEKPSELERYQSLLSSGFLGRNGSHSQSNHEEVRTAPLIWWGVKQHLDQNPSSSAGLQQYAVLGHSLSNTECEPKPVLINTNAPWSAFLCGSQGSGKSHTLSCMLEGCLLEDPLIGNNQNPLAGIVFHYDSSESNGVCEAAYLCSDVKTNVLVSKSNYGRLKKQYEGMAKQKGGNITVQKLELHPSQLNTERMKTLMAVGKEGEMPLYMHVLVNLLREMAIQSSGTGTFNYALFKRKLAEKNFTGKQNDPLTMRFDLLESFLGQSNRDTRNKLLSGEPGTLTIIDLTDPVTDPDSACVLFDICLSIFLSQTKCGKVIALDEAHNYMMESSAAAGQFTNRLLKTIREQRHQGARVVIATQEPTINTKLLDLCSMIIVHRCTSPAWFEVLRKHAAGLFLSGGADDVGEGGDSSEDGRGAVFQKIVQLGLGESLLFCPTAAVGIDDRGGVQKMMHQFVKFRTRKRITADGGKTILAGDLSE